MAKGDKKDSATGNDQALQEQLGTSIAEALASKPIPGNDKQRWTVPVGARKNFFRPDSQDIMKKVINNSQISTFLNSLDPDYVKNNIKTIGPLIAEELSKQGHKSVFTKSNFTIKTKNIPSVLTEELKEKLQGASKSYVESKPQIPPRPPDNPPRRRLSQPQEPVARVVPPRRVQQSTLSFSFSQDSPADIDKPLDQQELSAMPRESEGVSSPSDKVPAVKGETVYLPRNAATAIGNSITSTPTNINTSRRRSTATIQTNSR